MWQGLEVVFTDMPRVARVAPGDVIFHVLNRANARSRIFERDQDYEALERVIAETARTIPVRLLAYCIMPNHWHMVLWPTRDGELGNFVQRLTTTHVRRWHLYRHSVGSGHLYQGTYKSFPVQDDEHFWPFVAMWSRIHFGRVWCREQKIGSGRASV